MNAISRTLSSLQAPVGGLGFILWLASFQAASWLREHNRPLLADSTAGYCLGFGTAFAAWIASHLFKGNGSKFIDDNRFFKWISIFTLAVIFLFGIVGFLIDVFGDTTWQFTVGFIAGGFVMSTCFGPIMNAAENL